MLQRLLQPDPKDRISLRDCVSHEWLGGNVNLVESPNMTTSDELNQEVHSHFSVSKPIRDLEMKASDWLEMKASDWLAYWSTNSQSQFGGENFRNRVRQIKSSCWTELIEITFSGSGVHVRVSQRQRSLFIPGYTDTQHHLQYRYIPLPLPQI